MAFKSDKQKEELIFIKENQFKCQWCNEELATCMAHVHSKKAINKMKSIHKNFYTPNAPERGLGITCDNNTTDGDCDGILARDYETKYLDSYILVTLWKQLAELYFRKHFYPDENSVPIENIVRSRDAVRKQLEESQDGYYAYFDHKSIIPDWKNSYKEAYEEAYKEGRNIHCMVSELFSIPINGRRINVCLVGVADHLAFSFLTKCSISEKDAIKLHFSSVSKVNELCNDSSEGTHFRKR